MCTQVLHFVVKQVGSKGEAVADLEKEKEELHPDRTLASTRPDAGPCV
jgi:hypothetical protein